MKILVVCAFIACVATSGVAVAGCADAQSHLSLANLRTLLGSHYVCGRSSALNPPGWNELHNGTTGGSLVEQHEGGSTVETVGTWSTANVASNGRVTYSYSGGVTPVYEVAAVANVNCQPAGNCTTLNTVYQFCGVGGGAPAVLNIYVSASFQAPTASGSGFTMNANCPVNP